MEGQMESPERLRDWVEAGKQVGKDFELERDGEYWIGGMALQKVRDAYVAYFWEVPERLCALDEYVREERASFPRLEEALSFLARGSGLHVEHMTPLEGQKLFSLA
ncbi:hypothetical protein ATI61_108280 [Archangium gephyra]|uniref:Uncharacterized protein n=2 Tax=Archangium gephyra TaxID=48 RepID=A0AAC8Q852_9BACT|nr:Hypothetical protein AA314_03957 [Archangium gephyra]REG28739.1 hypothetical protein ATI61_108280 [Archangium gephyra]